MNDKIFEAREWFVDYKSHFKDGIKNDLRINIDDECSNLYDCVEEKHIHVSFDDIIETTISKVIEILDTFNEEDNNNV